MKKTLLVIILNILLVDLVSTDEKHGRFFEEKLQKNFKFF